MSSLKYIAILGRQPELGLVELESLLGADAVRPFGRNAALMSRELDLARLGGVQKIGRVLYDGPAGKLTDIEYIDDFVLDLPMSEGKTPFAISVYGRALLGRAVMGMGLEFKKYLRERGSVRLIAPSEGTVVSAAQLKHNQVLERGFELVIVISDVRMKVALTTQVQDIDWYSKRDYHRPARSAKVGMLPPKLAQVLVNTTSSAVVADPFCGTGVVLQETLLPGRTAVGSDLADEMVAASRQNLAWLSEQVAADLPDWRVDQADARKVRLPEGCAVVSEGYLGPNLTHSPAPAELAGMKRELLALYREALANFAKQLPSGGEVSICAPAWRIGKRWEYLGLVDELPDLGYTLKSFQHARTHLLYARQEQVVGRQLLLLRKI
jgi:tRNA G10  N-methylase Trm11